MYVSVLSAAGSLKYRVSQSKCWLLAISSKHHRANGSRLYSSRVNGDTLLCRGNNPASETQSTHSFNPNSRLLRKSWSNGITIATTDVTWDSRMYMAPYRAETWEMRLSVSYLYDAFKWNTNKYHKILEILSAHRPLFRAYRQAPQRKAPPD